jgi:hypothetical protein
MHGHKGKITVDAINAVEIVGKIELEEISAEATLGQPFQIDLRWGDNEPAEDYYRNQDAHGSLLGKSAGSPEFHGIIYTSSGEDKEDWHYPEDKEIYKSLCSDTGLSTFNMPTIEVKEPGIMKEKYGEHGQDP